MPEYQSVDRKYTDQKKTGESVEVKVLQGHVSARFIIWKLNLDTGKERERKAGYFKVWQDTEEGGTRNKDMGEEYLTINEEVDS